MSTIRKVSRKSAAQLPKEANKVDGKRSGREAKKDGKKRKKKKENMENMENMKKMEMMKKKV